VLKESSTNGTDEKELHDVDVESETGGDDGVFGKLRGGIGRGLGDIAVVG